MNKKDLVLLSVTGKPGLYRLLGHTKSGIFAQHITSGKRIVASPFAVSMLDDIVIYTEEDKVPLTEVIKKMAAYEGRLPAPNAPKEELQNFFRQILPDYDADKFYPSHMKKILQWFDLLRQSELLDDFVARSAQTDKEETQSEK